MKLVTGIATPSYCEVRAQELMAEAKFLRVAGKIDAYHSAMNQVTQLIVLSRILVTQ